MLSLLFPLLAFACGGWSLEDLETKRSATFLAVGGSLLVEGGGIHPWERAMRAEYDRVVFRNGDQARFRRGEIIYWKRERPAEKKWLKRKIGTYSREHVEL